MGSQAGSSPLARGAREAGFPTPTPSRFIPARAGSTTVNVTPGADVSVHPRSRGEHRYSSRYVAFGSGSSPLARGAPRQSATASWRRRFIPARAGSTNSPSPPFDSVAVHPRSRGEHKSSPPRRRPQAGSSPLARGAHHSERLHGRDHRFIPARAGSTSSSAPPSSAASVHPRSRGEHVLSMAMKRRHRGSSPLARGAPPPPRPGAGLSRFIPARAGSTPAKS